MAAAVALPRILAAAGGPPPPPSGPLDVCTLGKHVYSLYTNAMDEGGKVVKDIVKLVSYGCFWAKHFVPSTPAPVSQFGSDMRHMKNVMSAVLVPYKIGQVMAAVDAFFKTPSWKTGWNVLGDTCSLTNELADTYDVVRVYAPAVNPIEPVVSGVNYAATFIGAGKGVIEDGIDIAANQAKLAQLETRTDETGAAISDQAYAERKANTNNTITLHWIKLASKTAYVALGALGLTAVGLTALGIAVLGTPLFITGIVTCLTVGTTLSLFGFFYERIVDPTGKTLAKYNTQIAAVQQTTSRP